MAISQEFAREKCLHPKKPRYAESGLGCGARRTIWRTFVISSSFARAFLSNQISLEQLSYAMYLGKLGEQVVLISRKAFEQVHYLSNEIADTTVYFSLRMTRDEEAREAYRKVLETEDENGVYMRDLIRGGKPNARI